MWIEIKNQLELVLDIGSISEKLNKFFKVIFKMRRLKYVELVSCKKISILNRRESFQAPNSVISGSKFAERISSAQRRIRNPVKHLRWSFCKNSEKLYKLDKVLNTHLLHAKGKNSPKCWLRISGTLHRMIVICGTHV